MLRVSTRGILTRTWLTFTFGLDQVGRIDQQEIVSTWRSARIRPSGPPITPDELPAYLDPYLVGLAAADMFSGVVVLIDDGKVRWEFEAGFTGAEMDVPIDADTRFDLASVSKMFVATAALQLREKALLDFSSPIVEYLPDYPAHIGERINVEQLLSHTTGLRLQEDEQLVQRLFRAQSFAEQFAIETQALAAAYDAEFRPLGTYLYSNENMDLAARIIEVAAGQGYYDYLQTRVFAPLEMTRTHPYNAGRDAGTVALGLTRQHPPDGTFVNGPRRGNRHFLFDAGRPAGGLVTSARDLARYAIGLTSGSLMSSEAWAEMTRPRALQQETTDFRLDHGLGIDVYHYPSGVVLGHGGGRPGASTRLDIFPQQGVALVVLSNYDYIAHRIAEHVQEVLMVGRFDEPPAGAPPGEDAP
ncbi:MAG TPA: serine hydrolase domain-containing protein [Candidatus Polarisedimenticolaceae bacterium]|nr:serine hydrolase domain-containing protein [Candidatus Polarisedimenticolaceae bacterium]